MSDIFRVFAILKEKKTVITRAGLWKIPHNTEQEDIKLKIGRYKRDEFDRETLESKSPKSELTLDNDEFKGLIEFISDNYEPFKKGIKNFISIDGEYDQQDIDHLNEFFSNFNKNTEDFFIKNKIIPDSFIFSLQGQVRRNAIQEFEVMLGQDLLEKEWQEWFKGNDWVLGSEFVEIIDERTIDQEHIADYLMKAYDGFLDIVEIKRPHDGLQFWAKNKDRDNHVPSSDLIRAIAQSTKYIYEVERESNSVKFQKRVGDTKVIKPRCTLIFGRSNDWDDEQNEAYRILNSSYHNLTIMTYDHVLNRAKRILGIGRNESH